MCIWCVSPRSRLASSSVLGFEAVDSALRLRLPPALRPREHHSLLLGCWDELSACRVCVADLGACGPTHILGCLIGSIVWHRNSCWTEPIADGNVTSVFVSSDSMEARKLPGISIVFNHCTASHCVRASLVAQVVKHVPAVQETWVQSLGQEDPLGKGMGILAWEIPWTEEPGGLQSMRSQRVGYDWATLFLFKKIVVYLFGCVGSLLGHVGVALWCLGL